MSAFHPVGAAQPRMRVPMSGPAAADPKADIEAGCDLTPKAVRLISVFGHGGRLVAIETVRPTG